MKLLVKVQALEGTKVTTHNAVTVTCCIPDISKDNSLLNPEVNLTKDEAIFEHHPFIKKIGKLVYSFCKRDQAISVMSSKGWLVLDPGVINGPWTNKRIKDNFNYFLEPTKEDGSANLTVCLLIDYSSQKNLYHAKKLIMHTLLTEKMYVRYHLDPTLTVKLRKIGFFTRHHPDFIHIEAMQLRVHKAMKKTFLRHKGRYDRIIKKFKARPIKCVEDLL